MSTDRLTRVNELLRREIGAALFELIRDDSVDLSAITITHVITSRNLRHARVLVSIRDHQEERREMLALLARHRRAIQKKINQDLKLKYTPRLSFHLDGSLEKGDDVLNLLSKLEVTEAPHEHPDTTKGDSDRA